MTKQTVLGRVAQLAKANTDALLDQAEDPQKMIDQLIREYTRTIGEAENTVADTLGNLRLTEQDHAEDVAAAAEWGGKAQAASRRADALRGTGNAAQADRFDHLAKVALGRQLRSEREASAAEPVLAGQKETITTLRSGLDRMRAELTRLQTRRDELVARSRSAQAHSRTADTVASIDVLDPASELGRFEDKVRREEARAGSTQELPASSLDGQFESLDSLSDAAEVDARLARLKTGTR